MDPIGELQEDLSYEVKSVVIKDHQIRQLQSKNIALVKVVWKDHNKDVETWE